MTTSPALQGHDEERKLPLGKALYHTWQEIRRNAVASLFISLPLFAMIMVGSINTLITDPAGVFSAPTQFREAQPLSITVLVFAMTLLSIVITLSQAVNWHRLIILDEPPTVAHLLRLDAPVWRYILTVIQISFVFIGLVILGSFAVLAIFAVLGASFSFTFPLSPQLYLTSSILTNILPGLVMVAVLWGVAYRFALKMPAVAVSDNTITFGRSWQLTRGNTMKFIAIFFLLLVVPVVVDFILFIIFLPMSEKFFYPAAMLYLIGKNIINVMSGLFFLSLLSTFYQFFVERKDFA